MLTSELFRPTFYVRRLMLEAGGVEASLDGDTSEAARLGVSSGRLVEVIWSSLEKVVVLLNLAGWECTEAIVVARPDGAASSPLGAVRMAVQGRAAVYDGDLPALLGTSPGTGTMQMIGLRVTVRRTLGQASLHPPIDLTGVPGYAVAPDSSDDFRDARDGWICPESTTWQSPVAAAMTLFPAIHDELVTRLVAGLAALDGGEAAGMLRSLDPTFWDSALDRSEWLWPFDLFAKALWVHLAQPAELEAFLRRDLDDRDARLRRVAAAAGVEGDIFDALDALDSRGARLHPNNAALPAIIARLRKQHWLLALMLLHEYGLIGIVPFPLNYEPLIPQVDLTGTYETTDRLWDRDRRYFATLQVVQAGDRVFGWLYDTDLNRYELEAQVDPGKPSLEFSGKFFSESGNDTSARIYDIPEADTYYLSVTVKRWRETLPMVRVSRAAPIDPKLLEARAGDKGREGVHTFLAPLHSGVAEIMDQAIAHLRDGVAAIVGLTGRSQATMVLTGEIEEILEDGGVVVFTEDGTRRPIETATLRRFRLRVQTAFQGHVMDGVDAWTHLFGIIEDTDGYGERLRVLLGLPDAEPHKYTYVTAGVGASADLKIGLGASASGYYLYFNIEHHSSCAAPGVSPGSHEWTSHYVGQTVGGGVGIGAGADVEVGWTVSTASDVYSPLEWTKDDWVGAFYFAVDRAGTLGAYAGGGASVTRAFGEAYLFVSGSKWAWGVGDGWTKNVGFGVGGGLGYGVNGTVGRIWARIDGSGTPLNLFEDDGGQSIKVVVNESAETNFDFDSAELTLGAKSFLQDVVARYRSLFERPGAFMQIEGDASPTGPEAYNEQLSWRRALAVYAYLRSLLSMPPSGEWGASTAFALPPSRVFIVAYGEGRARDVLPDGAESEQWRRTKIVISDMLMVKM